MLSIKMIIPCNAQDFKLLDDKLGMPKPITPLWFISDIRFGHLQYWPLELTLERNSKRLMLIFRNLVSFRAQDGNEIHQYWAQRGVEKVDIGTIYQIGKSLYLDEFATSNSSIVEINFFHYVIAGYDLCVEVLAKDPPEVISNDSK